MGAEVLAVAAIASTLIGTGVSVYAQQQQAKTRERAAEYNNQLAEAEARNREMEAAEQARRSHVARRRNLAEMRNELAGTGLSTTAGTPLAILSASSANMEVGINDAMRQSNMQAAALRSQGIMGLWEAGQASTGTLYNSLGTVLKSTSATAYDAYGYKRDGIF